MATRISRAPEYHSFDSVVKAYIKNWRPRELRELSFYQRQKNLHEAITAAALAKTSKGSRHSHQSRISARVLESSRSRLLKVKNEIKRCTSFSELFQIVKRQIDSIKGIGELTVYDTTHRIGKYLGLEPETIYLHRGTREGAKTFGIDFEKKESISERELPKPFQKLKPYEIEDCLCIYKNDLKRIKFRRLSLDIQ